MSRCKQEPFGGSTAPAPARTHPPIDRPDPFRDLFPKAAVCTWQGWPRANSPCLLLEDSSDTGHGLAPHTHTHTQILCKSQIPRMPDARCSTVASETRLEAVGSYEQPFDYLRLIIAIKSVRLNSYVQFFRPTAAANSNVITP
jgi:hypothetical protein